ncbi:C-X-C motif chemokine 13 [Saccopteryx leptura]|uniref:C-X-C motif chemokine 13 n=1 Tax=Saccopteryx leptura TaxID=249018 RepID=UPI00339C534E
MRLIPGCLLLLLLVSSLSPVHGILEISNTNLRCRCTKTVSPRFRRQMILRIRTFRPWSGCSDTEIVVWLQNKSIVCLNPKSKRTQNLLRDILKIKS